MKILKIILYILLGLGAMLVLLGLFGKKDYHIERSIEIDAPRELVYDQIRYFDNFANWSPWAHLDPNMKVSISGTDGDIGAVYQWSGNDDVGAGKQTITALQPNRIDIDVVFTEPFESRSPTYFILEENGEKTRITWAFDMQVAFPWNGLAMFTDIDANVGKDYQLGLENLKKWCEELAHKKYRGYEVAVMEIPEKYYVGIRKTVPFVDIPAFFAANFAKAMTEIQKGGDTLAGAPSGLYWLFDEETGKADMAAAIPVTAARKFSGGLGVFPVGGAKALVVEYFGPYEQSGEAHYALDDYMAENELQSIPPVIEEYVTDPGQEPDTAKWLTRIIYFVSPKVDSTALGPR